MTVLLLQMKVFTRGTRLKSYSNGGVGGARPGDSSLTCPSDGHREPRPPPPVRPGTQSVRFRSQTYLPGTPTVPVPERYGVDPVTATDTQTPF